MAPDRPYVPELVRRNRRMSWVLLGAFAALAWVVASVLVALGTPDPTAAVGIGGVVALALTGVRYATAPSSALLANHARPAPRDAYPRLHNLVEEVALAAGVPVPSVYVVDDPAPNAFATGRSPDRAAIAVTTGLLDKLERSELEGVIAHEMAHIVNDDVRVMTIAAATAGTIAVLADVFYRVLIWGVPGGRGRGDRRGASGVLVLVAGPVLLILAPLAAALLRAAVSRRREALADATAVEITRNPSGLRRALEKLDADTTVVRHTSHATSHLWIEAPDDHESRHPGRLVDKLFATHPPLAERIDLLRRLEGLPPYPGPDPALVASLRGPVPESSLPPPPGTSSLPPPPRTSSLPPPPGPASRRRAADDVDFDAIFGGDGEGASESTDRPPRPLRRPGGPWWPGPPPRRGGPRGRGRPPHR